MKVYLVYECKDTYPYAVITESIHIFSTYETMHIYLCNLYNEYFDEDTRADLCKTYLESNWESLRNNFIKSRWSDTIFWEEKELE